MEFTRCPCKVYVKTNAAGFLTAVNSSAFLSDTTGWLEIDSGYGDKYCHAQGNYFPEPIFTAGGAYRYRLINGAPMACTPEELAEQETENTPAPTLESRVGALEAESAENREALHMLLAGVTE